MLSHEDDVLRDLRHGSVPSVPDTYTYFYFTCIQFSYSYVKTVSNYCTVALWGSAR
jgi:hypothetical protein